MTREIETAPNIRLIAKNTKRWLRASLEASLGSTFLDRLKFRQRRFEHAYDSGCWTPTGESMSGAGSSLKATENLRSKLPKTLEEFGVQTLLDLPCGDWNWMSKLELPIKRYMGGDIVASVVEENTRLYSAPHRTFQVMDLCRDKLPAADMLLCRDALIHFSYQDIWRAIRNIKKSEIEYVAFTTYPGTKTNTNQPTGIYWREINLEIAPFNFPVAIKQIVDNYNRDDQRLAFWRVQDLPS